jgi:hypothetical protein
MPKPLALKTYQRAREHYQRGDRDQAAQLLAEAMGAEKPSPILVESLDKFMEADTPPNDIVLRIIASEVSK